uniref:Uncharacterized protein n=1 Tax=Timema bartmani TaxID=61472 RepID=A0A7R9EPR3_9NEOP|nr:unnamed protein product [Timema bartmani]
MTIAKLGLAMPWCCEGRSTILTTEEKMGARRKIFPSTVRRSSSCLQTIDRAGKFMVEPQGLMLEKSGYSVELVPSVHLSHVEIEAKGRTVFQCNIRFLEFNGDGEDDPLCRRAVQEVDDLYSRIAGRRPKVEPRAEVMSWRETEVENGSDTVEVARSASSKAERCFKVTEDGLDEHDLNKIAARSSNELQSK